MNPDQPPSFEAVVKELLKQYEESKHSLDRNHIAKKIIEELIRLL